MQRIPAFSFTRSHGTAPIPWAFPSRTTSSTSHFFILTTETQRLRREAQPNGRKGLQRLRPWFSLCALRLPAAGRPLRWMKKVSL